MLDLRAVGWNGIRSPESQSQRWDLNPLSPPYESGARPIEHRWQINCYFNPANLISRPFKGRLLTAM